MWVPLVWNRSLDGVRAYNTVVFDDHNPGRIPAVLNLY